MPKKTLDSILPKRGRGRPPKISASEVLDRADDYRDFLRLVWDEVWPSLSKSETDDDVKRGFQNAAPYKRGEFVGKAALVLSILKEPRFPKRRQTRINFLADSFAGLGVVTPRRSRDICARERARTQHTTYIIRYEFYVECSCGYKGHSENHACPKCGAPILQLPGMAEIANP